MKISLHRLIGVFSLGLLAQQVQAQELVIRIDSGPSLVGDYDPALGRIEIVQQGSNMVVTAYLKPGADFKGWGTAGFVNRCSNTQQQCIIPVSVLKAATSQPRIKATFASGTAYLLLHGMNSGTGTWQNLVVNRFGNSCQPLQAGQAVDAKLIGGGQRCFALQAGYANGWRNGDGMTYQQLGAEVTNVLGNIQTTYPGIGSFVLVGHSRGGLAARAAFATNAASMQKVRGLLTVGTPHFLAELNKNRLPSGRKYAYIASDGLDLGKLLGLNGQSVINFNIFGEGLGVFAPPLPLSAQQYLIRGKYNQNKVYANYRGDGIVALDSQKALPAPSLTASRTLWKTFHVDEPSTSLGYDAIIALLPTL